MFKTILLENFTNNILLENFTNNILPNIPYLQIFLNVIKSYGHFVEFLQNFSLVSSIFTYILKERFEFLRQYYLFISNYSYSLVICKIFSIKWQKVWNIPKNGLKISKIYKIMHFKQNV